MKSKNKAQIFHFDLYGKREEKYNFLNDNSLKSINWNELQPEAPNYFLVNKDFEAMGDYEMGFSVNELFPLNNVGIVTAKDTILIGNNQDELINSVENHYSIIHEESLIRKILYRPFDSRYVYYDIKLVERAREKVMQHFLKGENVGLIIGRQGQVVGSMTWNLSFITNSMTDLNLYYRGGGVTFPLYLYPEVRVQQRMDMEAVSSRTSDTAANRTPNLNPEIVKQIAEKLGLSFVNEKSAVAEPVEATEATETTERKETCATPSQSGSSTSSDPESFAPIDILDYIYAVLHSPTYREKYKEFLKIDFPRVPYPKDKNTFWQLVKLGGELRQIHLLESPIVEQFMTQYPVDGDNEVLKPIYENGNVYINDTQYFANVPEVAWNFYIGGYQPAQKWLKDRKGRKLEFEDILHYQKIVVALWETERIMGEIDLITF